MCWYNDDDTTKYCQYTIGGYVSSVHLLFDSNGSRKLREAVQNQTEFSPMVALVTEKDFGWFSLFRWNGITGALVLFDRSTGSDTRGALMRC
ncbi:MAG: hypothetical protein ACLTZB_00725 [Streptococcus salivarius]